MNDIIRTDFLMTKTDPQTILDSSLHHHCLRSWRRTLSHTYCELFADKQLQFVSSRPLSLPFAWMVAFDTRRDASAASLPTRFPCLRSQMVPNHIPRQMAMWQSSMTQNIHSSSRSAEYKWNCDWSKRQSSIGYARETGPAGLIKCYI